MAYDINSKWNDFVGQFFVHIKAKKMWDTLRVAFAGTYATRLRQLQICFYSYKMDSKHLIAEHLKRMSATMCDLKAASNFLLKKHRVRLYCALPKFWETMKLTTMHNENTLDPLSCGVILNLKRTERDSKLIELFLWLSPVITGHLGSNASVMANHIMVRKLSKE